MSVGWSNAAPGTLRCIGEPNINIVPDQNIFFVTNKAQGPNRCAALLIPEFIIDEEFQVDG